MSERALWSADPLVSYRAASTLLEDAATQCRRVGRADDWLGTVLAGALDAAAPTSIPARGLTNLLEALRRLVETVAAAYEREVVDDTEEEARPEPAAYAVATVAKAFLDLKGKVLALVDGQAPGVERTEEEEEDVELALAWLLKLAKELHRSSHLALAQAHEAPEALAALCHEAWMAAGRRAVARGLPASCSGMVAARQEVLELTLALLEAEGGDGASLSWAGLALVLRLVEGDPADIPEEAEAEPGLVGTADDDGEETTCSLVREARSKDLLPYRLALLAACLRRVGQLALSDPGEENGARPRLTALLRCPLRQRYMAGPREDEDEEEEEDEEGGGLSSPLVAALLSHDDLLLATLNDLQRLGIALLTAPAAAAIPGDAALLREFTRANAPAVLLAALLEVVDQELLLEYLVSNETRALEYVTRAVKFLIWRFRQVQQAEEEDGMVVEVAGFLVGLGDRLQSLVRRGLFPIDIRVLLERMGELRVLLDSAKGARRAVDGSP